MERGWYDLAAFLIREHADVNFPDQYGITPLHVAAVSEQSRAVHIIMALLRANADPNAQDWVRGFVDRAYFCFLLGCMARCASGLIIMRRVWQYKRTPLHLAASFSSLTMIVILLCSGGDPTARDKVRGSTVHRDMAPFSVAGDPERDGGRRTVACSVQCRPKRKIASVCCTGGVCCTYALVPYCCPLPTTRGICGRLDVCTCRHNWPITMGEYDLVNRKVTITHVFPNNDRLVCVSTAAGLSSAFDGRNGGRDSRSKKTNANMLVGDYIMEAKNLPPMEQVRAAMRKYVKYHGGG